MSNTFEEILKINEVFDEVVQITVLNGNEKIVPVF